MKARICGQKKRSDKKSAASKAQQNKTKSLLKWIHYFRLQMLFLFSQKPSDCVNQL